MCTYLCERGGRSRVQPCMFLCLLEESVVEFTCRSKFLFWITKQPFQKDAIIHSDYMGTLIIISTSNFGIYPEVITIFIPESILHHHGTQVFHHWFPNKVNLEGKNRLNMHEMRKHIYYLIDKFIFD